MSRILTHLKAATASQHDQLETVSYAREIISQRINRVEYRKLLEKSALLYQMLEPVINNYISKSTNVNLKPFLSYRLAEIEKDLTYFGTANLRTLSLPTDNLNINSDATLIGTLYVLEGARLGGKVIVKALRKNQELSEFPAFNFYQQSDIDTRQRWLAFRELAENLIIEKEEIAEASRAANQTFIFFHQVHSK